MNPPSASDTNLNYQPGLFDSDAIASNKKPDTEKELKLLTPNGSDEPFRLFAADLEAGSIGGLTMVHKNDGHRLIARQLDTPDQYLRRRGISLRIRGTYTKDGRFITPDINIKTKRIKGTTGMQRGEYEEHIQDGGVADISVLERKYEAKLKAGKLPDLQIALNLIKSLLDQDQIMEHFLIDTWRDRRVVHIEPGFSDGRQFYGEMLNDKVGYHVRSLSLNETRAMTVIKGLRELELEPIHTPCVFNPYAGCENHACIGLDEEDEDLSLLFLKEAVMGYADTTGIAVEEADMSKSERGFHGLNEQIGFFDVLQQERSGRLATLFSATAAIPLRDVSGRKNLIAPAANINVPWALKAA